MKALALTFAASLLTSLPLISAQNSEDFIVTADDDNQQGIIGDWDPNWNYDDHGDSWKFLNCNNTKQQQSPIDLLP